MSTKSKIPVAVNSPTRSPDRRNSPSPSRGLSSRGFKKSFESLSSPETKPKDGQQETLHTGEEPLRNGTRSKLPCPSSSKTGAHLRRSSQRIPERPKGWVVPYMIPKDMPRPGQGALQGNQDDVHFAFHAPPEQSRPASSATETGQVKKAVMDIERQVIVPENPHAEETLGQPPDLVDEPGSRSPTSSIETTPDSPDYFPNQKQSPSNNARPLLPRSGYTARMDTISEHSAESESSAKGKRPSLSLPHPKSYRVPKKLVEYKSPTKSAPDSEPIKNPDEQARVPPLAPPSPLLPPPLPPPLPSPPMPSPDPAAVVERTRTDTLSLNADVKAIQTYMYGDDRDNLARSSLIKSPGFSCRSVDKSLNGSTKSASSSKAESVEDGPKMDHKATQALLASFPRPTLSDTMVENSKRPLSMIETSGSSLVKPDEDPKRRRSIPTGQRDRVDPHTDALGRISELLGRNGEEMKQSMLFDAGDSPSVFQGQGQYDFDAAKQHLPRPSRPSSVHVKRCLTKQDSPYLLGPLLKVANDRMLSSSEPAPGLALTQDDNGLADVELDRNGHFKQAAGHHVNPSRAANLTQSLVSALQHEQSAQTRAQSTEHDSSYMGTDDPIMTLINRYREEEQNFWPLLVGFTCDSRAASAISWVYPSQRKSFRRVQPPILSFGHQIQRYCLKYVPGFDLSDVVKKLQAAHERGGTGSSLDSKRESSAAVSKTLLPPGRVRTGDQVRGVGGGGGGGHYRSLLDVKTPRVCGCDTGSTQCGHAESSRGSLKTSTKTWEWPLEEENRAAANPPTPAQTAEMKEKRPRALGFWMREDKGKSVDRPPETKALELSRSKEGKSRQDEAEVASPVSELSPKQHKMAENKQPVKDKSSGSPKVEHAPESPETGYQPSPKKSSTLTSPTWRSNSTSTAGTPSTPRTHFSSIFPEDQSRPPSPPPLTETEELIIQDALRMATDAISSLQVFMTRLQESYRTAQPRPGFQFQQRCPPAAQPAGPSYTGTTIRTQAQRNAFARYQDLVRSSPNYITAAMLVMDEQTRAIKAILDAAESSDVKAESGPAQTESGMSNYFTSLLGKTSKNADKVSSTKNRDEELKMTGALPQINELHVASGAATSEDKHDGAEVDDGALEPRVQVASELAASPNLKADSRDVSVIQAKPTGAEPTANPSQDGRQSLNSRKLSPSLLKLSFAGLRARHVASVHFTKIPGLDTYSYRLLTSLGERLDQFEEKLLALENRGRYSVSSGDGAESGSRRSGKTGLFKVKGIVLTNPWAGSQASSHESRRHRSPGHSAESPPLSPRSRGRSSTNSGGVGSSRTPQTLTPPKTQHGNSSPKSNRTHNTGKNEKWIEETRESIREMRQSIASMIQTIIARRPSTIGIVDTEERLSLMSKDLDEAGVSTGNVIESESPRMRSVSNSTGAGRTGPGSPGEKEAAMRVRHSPGCHYDPGMQASKWDIESKPEHGDGGIGLGIFGLGEGSMTDVNVTGGGRKRLVGRKPHPYSNGSDTRESSTASIPLDVCSPAHQHCPGCGVDLVQSSPQVSSKEAPKSRGGPSQIAWASKVMGPLGRKKAGLYSVYPQSFGTQLLNLAKSEQPVRAPDEQPSGAHSPDHRPLVTREYVEQEREWDADDDLSASSRERRGRQARRRSVSEPLVETSYDRLTGRGEGHALLKFKKTKSASNHRILLPNRDTQGTRGADIDAEHEWRAFGGQVRQAESVQPQRHIKFDERALVGCHGHDHGHRSRNGGLLRSNQTGHGGNTNTDDDNGLGIETGKVGRVGTAKYQERRLARPKSDNALNRPSVGVGIALSGPDDSGFGMTPSPSTDSNRPGRSGHGLAFNGRTHELDSSEMSGNGTDGREHWGEMESESEPLLGRRDRRRTM